MKIKINIKKKSGTGSIAQSDWQKIQPVNNLLHSLFKTVDLEIDGKSITQSPQTYAYKAYFESCLGYTDTAKVGLLSASLYYQDDTNKSSINATQAKYIEPSTIDVSGEGKSIDLCGKLHLDLAMQPKPIIGGTKIKITLVPNEPEFYLFNPDDTLKAEVKFENAALYVSKSIIKYPVVEAHNLVITDYPAIYPIMRGVVKSFSVNTGTLDINLDNAIPGQVPRRCFVALVDSRGYNPNIKYNPFNFEHFNVNHIVASLDGQQFPSIAYTPNFDKDLYIREFIGLYDTLNQTSTDTSLTLDRSEYKNGNVIYGFTFANDQVDDCNKTGYVNPISDGSIRFSLKFASALTSNINVLVYSEFDNLVQMDSNRNPICDYL